MDNELYSWTIQQYQDFSIELLSTELASYGKGDNIEIGKDTNAFILILSGTATVINNENFMLNRKMIDMPHSVQNNTLLFSPKLMLTSLSVLSSDFKCLIIQFRMYGSITDPNPKSVMDYGQVLKFHELSISLPRRILLQPAVEPYSFFIRIIDEIKASSDAGSDLFIKSLLTAIIIRLLRDSTPESNRSISFFNSICFSSFSNNETPIEQGTSIWITDVDIYDRATSTFDESRQIAHLPLTFIHQELPEKDKLSFAIDPQTNYNGKPTAQIIAYETSPFRLWIFMNAEQTGINIADCKDTCCFRFSIKANRPVSLGMAFIDDENGSYNQQVITLSHANRWETVTVFLNPAKNYNSSAQHIQKALHKRAHL